MNLLNYFLTVFISIFLVVDVISNVPIFLSLTQSYEKKERADMAKKAIGLPCWFSSFLLSLEITSSATWG